MALPIDITDPGTSQVPLINVGDQAFGAGLPAQVAATVEDNVVFSPRVQPGATIGIPSVAAPANITDPGTQQVPLANVADQVFGRGLPTNVFP